MGCILYSPCRLYLVLAGQMRLLASGLFSILTVTGSASFQGLSEGVTLQCLDWLPLRTPAGIGIAPQGVNIQPSLVYLSPYGVNVSPQGKCSSLTAHSLPHRRCIAETGECACTHHQSPQLSGTDGVRSHAHPLPSPSMWAARLARPCC